MSYHKPTKKQLVNMVTEMILNIIKMMEAAFPISSHQVQIVMLIELIFMLVLTLRIRSNIITNMAFWLDLFNNHPEDKDPPIDMKNK